MALPIYQIVKGMRTFNGSSTSSEQWLARFETECNNAQLDEKWVIENLDRVLTDKAHSWWAGVSRRYENGLTAENSVNRWVNLKQVMNASFGRVALKEQAKLQAKQLRFSGEGDPQDYVYKKLEILALIDPNMSQEEKLVYLEAGLPKDIARMMSLATDDGTTPEQFVKRLRKYLKVEQATERHDKSSTSSHSGNYNPRFNKVHNKRYENRGRNQTVENNISQGSNNRTGGERVCYNCRKPGHFARNCPERKVNSSNKPHYSNNCQPRTVNILQHNENEVEDMVMNPEN